MAFKSVEDYNNERYGGLFQLQNDGDYADVIFMYRSKKDALVADTHYIKSGDYNGYVHCCGRGCPACGKGIRVQTKLFVPLYVLSEKKILFFDRNVRFDAQLNNDVFSRYPNPSEYVFRITRHGAYGDVNTRYEIMAVGKNNIMSYTDILNQLGIVDMVDYYSNICKEYSAAELNMMLNNSGSGSAGGGFKQAYSDSMPDYQVTARRPVADVSAPPAEFVATDEAIPEDSEYVSDIDEDLDGDVSF